MDAVEDRVAASAPSPRDGVALVLCGGGARGAIEVGLYLALEELGVPVTAVVGSSIGALNGAWIASGMPAAALATYWRRLRRVDLAVLSWTSLLQGLAADGLLSARAFRRHLARTLPVRRFEELRIPLTVVATDLMTGAPVEIRDGDLLDAVQASCAVPGLFPPVSWNGRQLVDGGIANNLPVDVALRQGAGRVVGILCRCCPQLARPARGLVRIVSQAFSIAVDSAQHAQLSPYRNDPRVLILAPEIAPERHALEFGDAGPLIEHAHAYARSKLQSWLTRPCPPAPEPGLPDAQPGGAARAS